MSKRVYEFDPRKHDDVVDLIVERLRANGDEVQAVIDREQQKAGIDIKRRRPGTLIWQTIDVKLDEQMASGNIAFELYSNVESCTIGAGMKDATDVWYYVNAKTGEVHILPVRDIRRVMPEIPTVYIRPAFTGTGANGKAVYCTLSLLLPMDWINKLLAPQKFILPELQPAEKRKEHAVAAQVGLPLPAMPGYDEDAA